MADASRGQVSSRASERRAGAQRAVSTTSRAASTGQRARLPSWRCIEHGRAWSPTPCVPRVGAGHLSHVLASRGLHLSPELQSTRRASESAAPPTPPSGAARWWGGCRARRRLAGSTNHSMLLIRHSRRGRSSARDVGGSQLGRSPRARRHARSRGLALPSRSRICDTTALPITCTARDLAATRTPQGSAALSTRVHRTRRRAQLPPGQLGLRGPTVARGRGARGPPRRGRRRGTGASRRSGAGACGTASDDGRRERLRLTRT
jgi:hypothetical protein